MYSPNPNGPYQITRDLVKAGYRFTLTLYDAVLAAHVGVTPFPPSWMIERQIKGNGHTLVTSAPIETIESIDTRMT